ncbi:MAG: MlaD family protein [Bacteroidia bacterium]
MKIFTKETKVGIFVFIGIAIFVLGYNFLKGYDLFQARSHYFMVYDHVNGIVKSTQVTINGMKVGQVEDISMLHEGDASKILVKIVINSSIKLPAESKAVIMSTDLLGTKTLELSLSKNKKFLHSGDTLLSSVEETLASTISGIVSPLKEKSEQVLITLDRVLQSMNDIFDSTGTQKLSVGIKDFTGIMLHLRNVSEQMDQLTVEESAKIRNIFAGTESIMMNLKNNNELITLSIKNISRISDSIAASNLTATINHINLVMERLAITIDKINKGEGSLGLLANDKMLYENISKTSLEMTTLMKDMQDYPGRYFSVSVFGNNRATKQDKKREEDKKKGKN